MIEIGEADNGGECSLQIGDVMELTLAENPTTGYRLALRAPVGPVLEVTADSFAHPSTGLIGAGGLHSWRFRALEEGRVVLAIDNRRSWEPTPVGTFKITIDVRAR